MNLESKIESILFYKNEPLEVKELCKLLDTKEQEVREALKNLSESLRSRGVCLVQTEKEVSLATSPEASEFIDKIAKEEMSREIGKAGLETLAIVLYKGPVARREIDYIRGVNSAFILRNLCMRGLVDREQDAKDQRVVKYRASLPLLAHLGIRKLEELPDFDTLRNKVKEIIDNEPEHP